MTTNTTASASLNLTINDAKRAIVMTKKFAKSARLVGSAEYRMLQEAREAYPFYRVEVRTTKAKTNSLKGLNYKYMELYIKKHDKDSLEEFIVKTAKIEDLSSASYLEVKKWFLETYPDISNYDSLRDAYLAA